MENKKFKPYIPAEKVTPEFTATSIIIGVLLAVIFGDNQPTNAVAHCHRIAQPH